MSDPEDFQCKFLSREAIWAKADSFRARYWPQGTLPIDMDSIVESLGLHIIPEHRIFESLQIDAFLKSDLEGIVVDQSQYMDKRDRYANRLRFTFAHEVGHFTLHKYLYEKFTFSTLGDFFEFQRDFPEDQYSYFEYQANEFAGRLLVPREDLVRELNDLLGLVRNDPRFSRIMKSDPEIILNRLTPRLCRPFGVSEEAIKRRVQREQLWSH